MLMWVVPVVATVTIVAAVVSIVTAVKNWPPRLDMDSTKRITRSLRRGKLREDQADWPAAVRLARSSAASHWTIVMLMGLALMQVLLAQTGGGLDSRVFYGVALFLVVAAVLTLFQMVRSRLILREAANRSGLLE